MIFTILIFYLFMFKPLTIFFKCSNLSSLILQSILDYKKVFSFKSKELRVFFYGAKVFCTIFYFSIRTTWLIKSIFFQYMGPFLINQLGSILYYFTLQNVDLSLAVPVVNSLTFLFTALSGRILGEVQIHKSKILHFLFYGIQKKLFPINATNETLFLFYFVGTYIGMFFILCGTTLCCLDKITAVEAYSIFWSLSRYFLLIIKGSLLNVKIVLLIVKVFIVRRFLN